MKLFTETDGDGVISALSYRVKRFVVPESKSTIPNLVLNKAWGQVSKYNLMWQKIIFTFYVNLLIGIKIISWHSKAHWKKIFVFGCGTLTLKHIQPPLALSVYPASKLIICPEIQRKWQATGSLVLSLLTRNLQFVTSIVPAFDSSIISETISVFWIADCITDIDLVIIAGIQISIRDL